MDSSVAPKRDLAVFVNAVNERRSAKPYERHGQATFNTLYFDGFDPEFADSIRGGPLDPYHRDDAVGPMLDALRERWSA
jgi:hypothetical protein